MKRFWLFIACISMLCLSCEKDDADETRKPVSGETLKVNNFIFDGVKDYYLWTSTIDWKLIEPKYEPDSYTFFDKLIYKTEDHWSMLTDDAQGFTDRLDGISTSFGYELIWGKFINSTARYAIVLYVYPGSPAEKAGLKRGDFLIYIDGNKDITDANYMDLYNAPSISLGKAVLTDNGKLMPDPHPVNMVAVTMYEDPVVKDTIVVKGTHRIGYLCYTNFTRESEKRLLEVFAKFKLQGVTDIVLDLRYNGGGYTETSRLLSSMLAPDAVVRRKDIYLTKTWNDELTAYFKKEGDDTSDYFMDNLPVNMELSRLYVLTLRFSASASEATMIGLNPYMDVIQIGEATHGKYYGGLLLNPMVYDRGKNTWVTDKEIENWLMYLMVYRYADRTGNTSFSGGLIPDYQVEENYNYILPPLGDDRDPLFGKAIELITGESVKTRSAQTLPHPHPIDGVHLRSPLNGKMIGPFNGYRSGKIFPKEEKE
jgi:C-terminal processing protease CtpA/Prc